MATKTRKAAITQPTASPAVRVSAPHDLTAQERDAIDTAAEFLATPSSFADWLESQRGVVGDGRDPILNPVSQWLTGAAGWPVYAFGRIYKVALDVHNPRPLPDPFAAFLWRLLANSTVYGSNPVTAEDCLTIWREVAS